MTKNAAVEVVNSKVIRAQYWRVELECGHTQDVHSIRDGGPLFVLRCQTCNPGKAREVRSNDDR